MHFVPYLNFDGRCAEAFRFYERLLGGRLEVLQTHGDSPIGKDVPCEWRDLILHARLVVGDQVLMGSDSPPQHHAPAQGIHVSLQIDRPEEAERVWVSLTEEGRVTMPLQQTFWAERFGMCVDRFGTPWMVNCGQVAGETSAARG